MEIKKTSTHKHSSIDNVCLTIAQTEPNQHHIGFLFYSFISKKVKFLHLAWHQALLYGDPPDDKYIWIDIPFDDKFNQTEFQLYLDTIYDENQSHINYGISIDGIEINPDGSLLLESKHAGLTCATFVLRTFHGHGINIVDIDNWKHRAIDIAWQEYILSHLITCAVPEYIKAQKINIGTIRFKPEEIAVAAASEDRPLSFEDTYEPSIALGKILEEHNKTLEV